MDTECAWCDGEGYVPCEECNDSSIVIPPLRETHATMHKQEVRYWEMVKQEIEQFNQQVIGRG